MKSSTQVFASLVAALATLSQSAIAASNPTFPRNSSIDWHSSSLDSSPANSFKIADRAVIIDNDALTVGSINRTNLLKCSESAPCIEDKLVIDRYKETLSSDGAIREATIALYNTSPAPAAIEVYSSDGKFKSVDFVDGIKPGFKDFGDLLQTTTAGLIEPFTCASKGSVKCWNEFKYGRYGVKKSEQKLKLQTGDVIRISRGSEPARLYADILEKMDILELMIAGSEMNPAKKTPLTLKNNFSPELRRKIIAGYIKKKMNEKYTWAMIMREFGYTTAKKTLNNPLEFFNNATEVAKNIPADFWEATTDGTVASKVAGDGLSLIIESASKKASLIVDSALFISQSVNIYARSTASENAFKNPYPIVMAYTKLTKNNSPRVTARFPIAMQAKPSLMLKKAIPPIESKFSFTLVDLNNDGNKEAIVMTRPGLCGNRSCPVKILKLDNQKKSYNLLSENIATSRELNLALLPTKSNGWQDLAVSAFSYETRTIDWYAVKFDGKTYKSSSEKLTQVPKNIILSEKSPAFDLGNFPVIQTAESKPKPSTPKSTKSMLFKYYSLGGIYVGDTEDQVYNRLGKPIRVESHSGGCSVDSWKLLTFSHGTFYVSKNGNEPFIVTSISTRIRRWKTNKGIRVGDNISQAKKHHKLRGNGSHWFDSNHEFSLSFNTGKNGEITEIVLMGDFC